MKKHYEILLTNDDGINSPGLWTAAEALSQLGYVHVVAPRDQYSGAGRSMPSTSDGRINIQEMKVNGKTWEVYSVGGSPAQTVEHAIIEILKHKPDLVVSGINFGENVGIGITASGTVGAAIEAAAAFQIPAMAVSLETPPEYYLTHSSDIDFSVAGYFTIYFGEKLLYKQMPVDVDILKIDVPANATKSTAWEITGLSRVPYYELSAPARTNWDEPAKIAYQPGKGKHPVGSDCHALLVNRTISVTPLSADMTSRVDFDLLRKVLVND